jgi:hypothetical protein
MQVRGEDHLEIFRRERGDVLVSGGGSGATNHSRAEIDKVSGAVYDNGNRWSGSIWIDDGRAGAENDDLGVRDLGDECSRTEEKGG